MTRCPVQRFLFAAVCCGIVQGAVVLQAECTYLAPPHLHYHLIRVLPELAAPEPVPLVCEDVVVSTPLGRRRYSLSPLNEHLRWRHLDFDQWNVMPAAEDYVSDAAGVRPAAAAAALGHAAVLIPRVCTNIRPVGMLSGLLRRNV